MEEERMTPGYFQLIQKELLAMDQPRVYWLVQMLIVDVEVLEMFCMSLETWKYSSIIGEENDEIMERLRSVIASLKLIWPEDFTLILSLLRKRMGETIRPIYKLIQDFDSVKWIQDFDSVKFELEGKILQSKQQVEGWCRNIIHSSSMMMMQHKSSGFRQMSDFVNKIRRICYYTANIHPWRKPTRILEIKIEFLQRTLKKANIHCPDGKENLRFMNFAGNYANSVAWLACLYWAKEDNDHEVLFDMLHKFIPYTYDIAQLYVGILKSNDVGPVSDYFLLGEAVESFVDFFFDHLAIVLKDDFLFLRDRLIFLLTFLTDPICEDVEEAEGDSIRTQIYAILHEDVYLLLSFEEMNKDFSDKKTLFSACMIRIDIVNAMIGQLYRGSSGSQITLEVEKMEYNYFVSLHRELSFLDTCAKEAADMEQLQLYEMELRFLRMFFLWLATWDDTDEEIKLKLSSVITSFQGIWGENDEEEGLLAHRFHAIRSRWSNTNWNHLAFELKGKIQQSKLETEAWRCVDLFHLTFRYKTSTSYNILKFMDSILDNLNDLVSCKASEIIPFKKQIETLEEKLIFLKNLLKLAVNCKYCQDLGELEIFVQAFAGDAARLAFLCWTQDANAENASDETNSMFFHLLQKIKPSTPNVARLYFGTLMAIYAHRSDSQMFRQTAFSFVEFFLEDLATHLKDDDFQILQDNIICLLTFLNDPPNQNAEESICSRIDVLFWEGLYCLIPFDDIERGFSKKKVLLSDFMMKIEAINADIRCIYGKFPDSSLYNFPKVISPQFLDFLLKNLKSLKDRMNSDRKYVSFAKYKIIKIEEELASLHPFFIHIFDLQSEQNETWLEVVNVLHLMEHDILTCISSLLVFDPPYWYHMAYLSKVFDEIKAVKAKIEKIKLENIINKEICLPGSVGFISEVTEQGQPFEINEFVVGFEDEKEKIIGLLTRGPMSLDIVSIVGMGGLGKTTLAKKVLGSSSVKSHFNVFAFCSISVDHNTWRMLHDIVCQVKGVDDISRDMTNDDLAHELRKCLSGQMYLIVLDDIWNVSAWNAVKSSFPDNQNGSRVMFTTRSRDVADKCKINCSPHQLRFLNEVESWEMLENIVFRNDISPPYLHEIGNQIAKNCKGLALAAVVIGGLLARMEKSLRWWSEVERRLAYYLSNEGCMEIMELSYKHLPENLKPCLIYLAAFPEDCQIDVNRVIRLWITEGFVQETKTKSIEDVAKEHFHDLVDRSLIIVGARSSSGGIKTFHVHDLIHEFCQTKCRDGNFFQLNHGITSSSTSNHSIKNPYRVSVQREDDNNIAAGSSLSNARTLCYFSESRYAINLRNAINLRKLTFLQVLDSGLDRKQEYDINKLSSLIHLRYIDVVLMELKRHSIPSWISNLWNITSLKLRLRGGSEIHLPETFWRMKSLRYVKVFNCILKFPDGDDKHDEAYLSSDQILDKVVSFSCPNLYTGKDVKRLLQRLPVVRKLCCYLGRSRVYDEGSIKTFDFYRELESLRLSSLDDRQYMINFPSTLKKLALTRFQLHRTDVSAIAAELHVLEVLYLSHCSFVEPTLETEDLVFQKLKFFHLNDDYLGEDSDFLEEWNASTESFPRLQQLEIYCKKLKEFPSCFGENSTLKRIDGVLSTEAESSALRIKEELMDLGTQLEFSIKTSASMLNMLEWPQEMTRWVRRVMTTSGRIETLIPSKLLQSDPCYYAIVTCWDNVICQQIHDQCFCGLVLDDNETTICYQTNYWSFDNNNIGFEGPAYMALEHIYSLTFGFFFERLF